ncbi:MAG TPA: hypothetical protein VFI65_13850 [Streptosporangiaceae bacterium]|nr:hypothetical protein [Streptosporangiaceae bacterium]
MNFSGGFRRLASVTVIALAASGATGTAVAGTPAAPGSVTQVPGLHGCYTVDGSGSTGPGVCTNIRGGAGATTVSISPDGRSAYLVGYGGDADAVLSVFSRNTNTGVLTQLAGKAGCLSNDGSNEGVPGVCTRVRDLDSGDAISIAISRDGRSVYVASQFETKKHVVLGGVAVFSRSLKTGALFQLKGKAGCVTSTGASNRGPGTCAVGREVDLVSNLQITPDQKYVYASNYDSQPDSGIAIFRRDSKTGALTQLGGKEGCITSSGLTKQSGTTKICRAMPNIGSPWDVATAGNKFAYIPDRDDDLVQAFSRDAKGGLKPLTGLGACVSDTGDSPLGMKTCRIGRGLFDVERAVLSANQKFIYTNSFENPSPIAVLNRNPTTGLLSERNNKSACYSLDGTGTIHDATPTCRNGRDLSGGYAGALSPDGKTLYYAENGSSVPSQGLVIFHVNEATGGFTQLAGTLGCVSPDGSSEDGAATCQTGPAVHEAYQVAVARGGGGVDDVYVAAFGANGIDFFRAAP